MLLYRLLRLPFVTLRGVGDDSRVVVNWGDAGFTALGIVLVAVFDGIASIIGAIYQAIIIAPVSAVATGLADIVKAVVEIPANSISTLDGLIFALNTGYAGAILLVFVGAFVLAWTVQVIR